MQGTKRGLLAEESARTLSHSSCQTDLLKFISSILRTLMKCLSFLIWFFCSAALLSCTLPQELDLIRREQWSLRSEYATLSKRYNAMRQDIDRLQSALADTRANLDGMQQKVSSLREKVGEVRYQFDRRIGKTEGASDQKIQELESRLTEIDEELREQAMLLRAREQEWKQFHEALKAGGVASEPVQEKTPTLSEDESKDYEDAMRLLEEKNYQAAIVRLKDFLRKHPQSELADNAQYWIGECYYALKEFDQAILEFNEVRLNYPQGDKAPAALLKQAFAFAELGGQVEARWIFQEIVEQYPESEEAVKAKERLKRLES